MGKTNILSDNPYYLRGSVTPGMQRVPLANRFRFGSIFLIKKVSRTLNFNITEASKRPQIQYIWEVSRTS
jgi:hypothetical protein